MALPPTAKALAQPLDPSDIDAYAFDLSQVGDGGTDAFPLLQAGESVASFTLALGAEATAAGLVIKSGGSPSYPAPVLVGLAVIFWLSVDPAYQGSSLFDGAGTRLPLVLTITTNSTPPRVKQRTGTVSIVNQ